ncbi:hypothetical protein B0I31_102757 [Saccharothrix carnea]|uniref:Uncharacterized protein n=1 Tax=Saccharothrix carnea TaxID=1280637 RepID=A0A2P8IH29_SACCR|nr:hypothetical protein [Saccharothrix carnea]PSL57778.1 hypothetical protein B0I31_102757 [Saccharothrix carnea]
MNRYGDLGEAGHGTHEFYRWRAEPTRRLITGKGFSFVAVEGAWPACDRVDRAVRCLPDAPGDPRVAFHGLDVHSLWESPLDLREHDPGEVPSAPAAYRCFEPHGVDLLTATLPHRTIGVVYHPERERWGNSPTRDVSERCLSVTWCPRADLEKREVDNIVSRPPRAVRSTRMAP